MGDNMKMIKCDSKLMNTIIKRMVLCVFIGVLMNLFYGIASKKSIDAKAALLVTTLLAVIELLLKLMDECLK